MNHLTPLGFAPKPRKRNSGHCYDSLMPVPYCIIEPPTASRAKAGAETRKTKMARRCELTGKGPMSGNNVSHANNKTKRRFLPNLNDVTLISDVLGRSFKLRISAAALRTVDHRGGLDAFMAKAKDADLSVKALKIKKDITEAQGEAQATA